MIVRQKRPRLPRQRTDNTRRLSRLRLELRRKPPQASSLINRASLPRNSSTTWQHFHLSDTRIQTHRPHTCPFNESSPPTEACRAGTDDLAAHDLDRSIERLSAPRTAGFMNDKNKSTLWLSDPPFPESDDVGDAFSEHELQWGITVVKHLVHGTVRT